MTVNPHDKQFYMSEFTHLLTQVCSPSISACGIFVVICGHVQRGGNFEFLELPQLQLIKAAL